MTSISKLYEPSPRFDHGAAAVGGRCYLWGGRVQDFSASGRRKLASTIEIFDPYLETWEKHPTTGVPPPGLYAGACISLLDSLYWFGGCDGESDYNSLHRLDTTTLEWREIQPLNQADGPMRKHGCGIVSFLQDKLAVFGGYGIPTGPTQPGAMFTKNTDFTDGSGWSNELHVFNITEGKWSSPPTTGPRPPPCAYFSFTAINNHQAVFFGGNQPGRGGIVNDCYLLNFESMEWTKLEKPEGAPWPVGRSAHAACCLNYGEEHPQLVVTGGMDKNHNTLQDTWILNVNSGRWRELTLPGDAQPRIWHTATALSLGPGWTRVTMFGGSPKFERGKTDDTQQKLAKTTVLEFESVELPPSSDGPSTREWVLVGVADSSQLGSTKRLAELQKIKRKAEQAHMREIEELKKQVRQLEDELASAQRQTRLALARAVRAEIEADKVPVLEQQLSQTKTNLEGQIQMKDQARIAAEQQLQQTKGALEHEIHMKDQAERQFNQEKAGLQHEIQERHQTISSLQQQIHQTEKFLEHHKEAAVSAQQQFSHRVKNLEHQIEATEQARVALEMQIQAKDREKAKLEHQLHQKEEQIQAKDRERAELEHQLHQKEEQIRAKDKEKMELEQQICQIKEHRPPEVTQIPEMQQEGSGYVTAQGTVPSVNQLLQASEEGRKKEEELRQVKEDHQVEISRLTAKQQKMEFELKAQISTKSEKINTLRSQVDALQHDHDDHQQQLKERDIQIASISSELQYKQSRIETLTADRQELTRQVHTLEAKMEEEKFFRDHYSQEVDQLRDELMEKIVENEYLTKQQKDVVTADTLPTTSPAGGSDKMEVKDQNVQTNSLEMKDHNTQTEIVQIKDQQVQAESTTQQQAGFHEFEMNDQQIQTETVESIEHVETGNMTPQQGEVELKDQQAKTETVDQQVQDGETVHQQEPQFNHHTSIGGICFLGDPWRETVTSAGKEICWTDIGITIIISPGAVPEDEPITVTVRPCLSGPFELPEDYELASPVYAISPGLEFIKDVKLFLAHFADLQSEDDCKNMTFLTTESSSLQGDSHPYKLIVQKNGVFQIGSREGEISLKHFCKKAIGRKCNQDGNEPRGSANQSKVSRNKKQEPKLDNKDKQNQGTQNLYAAQLYQNEGVYRFNNIAAVTVTLHHPVYILNFTKCLECWYPPPFHFVPSETSVNFSGYKAIVEVPTDETEGWKIIPDIQPCEIIKEAVDLPISKPDAGYAIARTYPPKILLTISPPTDSVGFRVCQLPISGFTKEVKFTLQLNPSLRMVTPLSQLNRHGLLPSITDCETEHLSFNTATPSPLTIDSGFFSPSTESTGSSPRDGGPEMKPEIKDLTNAFYHKVADKWKVIGVLLEIPKGKLSRIADKHRDPCSCLVEMLETWLERVHPPPTWAAIIEAVEFLGEEQLGKELRDKYCPTVRK